MCTVRFDVFPASFPQLSWTLIRHTPSFVPPPPSPSSSLSSTRVAYVCIGVGSSAGAWTTHQGPQPPRKTNSLPPWSHQLPIPPEQGVGPPETGHFKREIERECLKLDPSRLGNFTRPWVHRHVK